MLAVKFGELHKSCPGEMEWRRSLPPTAMQAEAYLACQQGDWLLWQLGRLPPEQYEAIFPAIQRALDRIVERAIRRGMASLRGVRSSDARKWRRWAKKWLNGEDRSSESARSAVGAVAWALKQPQIARMAAYAAMTWGLDGETLSLSATWALAAAGWSAEERRLQVEDIRAEIPQWPGE